MILKQTRVGALTISPQHIYKSSTYAGTAGSILLTESIPGGTNKTITISVAGYTNTAALTIPFPLPFVSTPVTARALSPNFTPTINSTSAVIPIVSSATSGTIIVIGA